jgi:hypothetical protein
MAFPRAQRLIVKPLLGRMRLEWKMGAAMGRAGNYSGPVLPFSENVPGSFT